MTENEMVGWHSRDMSLSKLQEIMKNREACGAVVHGSQRVGHDYATEQQSIIRACIFNRRYNIIADII